MSNKGLSLVAKIAGAEDCRKPWLSCPISRSSCMNEKLLQILAATLNVDASALGEGTSTANTPAWDSVAHLNLVLSLEQEFGQRFSPEEFMQMQSVAAINGVLAAHGLS